MTARLAAAVLIVAGACSPFRVPAPLTLAVTTTGSLRATPITHHAPDATHITGNAARTVTSARPGSTGSNERTAWVYDGTPATSAHTACATFVAGPGQIDQPGILATQGATADGRRLAITVTRNVWDRDRDGVQRPEMTAWVNVNAWWLDRAQEDRHELLAQRPVPALAPSGAPVAYPWRACARITTGAVSVLLWALPGPQPAWGDPRHGYTVPLRPELVVEGVPGLYVAHLQPGESFTFLDFTVTTP